MHYKRVDENKKEVHSATTTVIVRYNQADRQIESSDRKQLFAKGKNEQENDLIGK